jgi:chromosome segregation ATPase
MGVAGAPLLLPLSAATAGASDDLALAARLRSHDDDDRFRDRDADEALRDLEAEVDELHDEVGAARDAVERIDEERDLDDRDVTDVSELLDEAEERLADGAGFVFDLDRAFRRGRFGDREELRDDAVDELLDVLDLVTEAVERLEGDDDGLGDDELDDLYEEADELIEDAEERAEAVDDAVDDARREDLDRFEGGVVRDVDRLNRTVARLLSRARNELRRGEVGEAEEYLETAFDEVKVAQGTLREL